MIIFEKTGKILLDIPVDDTSYRYRAIRQGDKVNLVFSLTEHVEIPVYSYVDYQGQRYTLWRPEDLTKHGTRNLEYSATFGGYWELLDTIKYKHLSAIPRKLKFQLTGKPRFFLELLIDNMNQSGVGGWSIGTCIDAPEKTLAFSHEFCLDALNRFADEWGTEFEIVSKTINFGKVEKFKDDPLPLSYGRGNGFKTGVGRKLQGEKPPTSILYVQGGERNIDRTAYGASCLLLPKSQELEYEGDAIKPTRMACSLHEPTGLWPITMRTAWTVRTSTPHGWARCPRWLWWMPKSISMISSITRFRKIWTIPNAEYRAKLQRLSSSRV